MNLEAGDREAIMSFYRKYPASVYPGVDPQIVLDSGPQCIAKDFKKFICISASLFFRLMRNQYKVMGLYET